MAIRPVAGAAGAGLAGGAGFSLFWEIVREASQITPAQLARLAPVAEAVCDCSCGDITVYEAALAIVRAFEGGSAVFALLLLLALAFVAGRLSVRGPRLQRPPRV